MNDYCELYEVLGFSCMYLNETYALRAALKFLVILYCFVDAVQGFYCDSEDDFDNLCRNLRRSFVCGGTKTPLFELFEGLPPSCSSTVVSTKESQVFSGMSVSNKLAMVIS